ncbi:MAG: KH domain-containing protein [bacterium]
MRELIERIAKAIVDQPEDVDVRVVEGEGITVLELSVAKSDMGRIIGKKGQTAKSMRTLLNAAGKRTGKNVVLEIMESAPSEHQ